MISNESLEQFKKIYLEKFNIVLTQEESTQMATDLINLMRVLLKPDPIVNNDDSSHEERGQDETIPARTP